MAVKANASITLVRVNDGSDGSDGVGIKSAVVTYQAGSSQTTKPTGTWSSTIPKLTTATPYLWTKTDITYTDGKVTTSYSVSSTLDGIEVGGRNLLKFTGNMPLGTGARGEDGFTSYITSDASTRFEDTGDGLKFTFKGHTANDGICVPLVFDGAVENNDTITISFYYRGTITNPGMWFFLQRTSPNMSFVPSSLVANETEWQYYEYKTTKDNFNSRTCYMMLIFSDNGTIYESNDWIEIKKKSLKLEKGNKATDWTPAPEDVDNEIGDIWTGINETKASIDISQEEILSSVSKTYTTKDELTSSVNTLTTQLQQTENSFNFTFDQIKNELGVFENSTNTQFASISKYIRFVNGDIILGESTSPVTLKIENDRISFLENNIEVMYITNQQLYINRAIVATRLDLGNFAWLPRSNGNVSFRFNG